MSLLDNASLLLTPNAYKEGKLYSVIPSNGNGDFTATRATTATRVNSAGLVDLVPYNLASWSEMFSNGAWSKNTVTITANTTTAPDGALTADTLTADGSSNVHATWLTLPFTSGTVYTYSIYAKKNTNNFLQLYWGSVSFGSNAWANFDLNLGVVGSVGSASTANIQDVGNGWYRCVITATATATGTNQAATSTIITSSTSVRAETNTLSTSVFIWGAQLVEGTSARDYLRTETRLNIPRVDYSLGGCPNILLEPQRTNLIQRSSEFDNATWVKLNATVTANAVISPSGIQDADRIQITNATSNYLDNASASLLTNGATYTVSVYARSFGATNQSFRIYGNGNKVSPTLTATPNWQRFEYTFTATSTTVGCGIGSPSITDIVAWGYQLEAGAYATSYIPTTTASVTRNLDVVQDTGVSSLIGQTEGTIYWEGTLTSGQTDDIFCLNRSVTNSVFLYKTTTNNILFRVYYGGATFTISNATAYTGLVKIAAAYKSGSSVMYINGVQAGTSATNFTFTGALNDVVLNNTAFLFGNATKYVKELALFPTRLTNSQLAALTA